MSSTDPFVAGGTIASFRLLDRVGASVWRAEDTRNGKTVALKVLTKQLPRDPARREAVIRDIRQGAALYHSSIVTILEITPADDALVMIIEWFDGTPVSTAYRGRAAERTEFFRVIYQLADAVKLMQGRNVLHLNIAGDSVLVASNGQVKLAGFNALTFLPRREGQGSAFSQKGSDPNAVSYMAPEQITNQTVSPQTDVFSLGVIMYEVATGRRPFLAATAAEIANKIVNEQPPSPKSINPKIDGMVLNVMGRCFFRDSFRRHKDAKAIIDEIVKVDGNVVEWSNEIARSALNVVANARHAVQARQSIILAADVANHDEVNAVDPAAARRRAAVAGERARSGTKRGVRLLARAAGWRADSCAISPALRRSRDARWRRCRGGSRKSVRDFEAARTGEAVHHRSVREEGPRRIAFARCGSARGREAVRDRAGWRGGRSSGARRRGSGGGRASRCRRGSRGKRSLTAKEKEDAFRVTRCRRGHRHRRRIGFSLDAES
jgi:hypothetical protein